jgi:AbrB family looped-hinge helix DNA binding protein
MTDGPPHGCCSGPAVPTPPSGGQTTIPKAIREALQLRPGDRVELILEDDQVMLRHAGADLTALDGMIDRSDRDPVSIETMNDAIARSVQSPDSVVQRAR